MAWLGGETGKQCSGGGGFEVDNRAVVDFDLESSKQSDLDSSHPGYKLLVTSTRCPRASNGH